VDNVSQEQWHEIVAGFDDAVIHQTWTFGALRWGQRRGKLSHIILYENDNIVAAAQLAIVSGFGMGIAHCKFGPMWRVDRLDERIDVYREMLLAMQEEYAGRGKLALRVKPWFATPIDESLDAAMRAAGLVQQVQFRPYSTFVIDMSRSMDELRAGFHQKWRYNLKKAEQQPVEISRASDVAAAAEFRRLYAEMREIKTFADISEVHILDGLLHELPDGLRPTIFLAHYEGRPVAAIVLSHIGNTAYYLFGATAREGRRCGASYLLFWDAMKWLKERDCRWFDLVGSTPREADGSEGYRRFKSGIAGKNNGREVHMVDWEVCSNWRSHVLVHGGTRLRQKVRTMQRNLSSLKKRLRRPAAG
jgi:hypothetical protein